MSIDSPFFLCVFLPPLAALHAFLPYSPAKKWLLLGASLLFCAFGSLSGVGILLLSALLTYWLSLLGSHPSRVVGILCNLVTLAVYKYIVPTYLSVPIGISFFTFRNISYLADSEKADSFCDYLLYLSFFPQLTAGPVSRYAQFQAHEPSPSERSLGLRRFIFGLSKKILLAVPLSQLVADAYECLDFTNAWLGAIGYMLEIYLDFSSYSDMAIGLSSFFGYSAPENFHSPYLAETVSDFWRRWHISLSFWFRDYVYIPLGGNRKGKLRTALHKLLVFILCGIWHGNGITYFLWGVWHGILVASEAIHPPKKGIFTRIYTLLAVCFGFVLFYSSGLTQAIAIWESMFSVSTAHLPVLDAHQVTVLFLSMLLCLPMEQWFHKWELCRTWLQAFSFWFCLILLLICFGAMATIGFHSFIYAQF